MRGLTLGVFRGARAEVYACPISYDWTDDTTSLHVGALGGITTAASGGWFVGLGISAALDVERKKGLR
jgi:hypothetical protein